MTDKILVLTTASSKDEARKIGRALVEGMLAACVNVAINALTHSGQLKALQSKWLGIYNSVPTIKP